MLIKRWIALLIISVCLVGLALAMGLAWIYREYDFPDRYSGTIRTLTLQFIAHPYRELIILFVGIPILYFAIRRLTRSIFDPLVAASQQNQGIGAIVAAHRFGPVRPAMNIVAIGGGTGLSTLLRGLRNVEAGITAIVTVADDGGSTGRIRKEFDIPAPGDIRSCLVALSDAESTVGKLFAYRFDKEGSELSGHSFGNLFITALTQVTGSFEQAVIESGRVLAVRGRVLPSTLDNVTLCAELVDGAVVRGESTISHDKAPIRRVFLDPCEPTAYEPALGAILHADLVVLGPGSLYTSVLPNLCVDGVIEAIRWSSARWSTSATSRRSTAKPITSAHETISAPSSMHSDRASSATRWSTATARPMRQSSRSGTSKRSPTKTSTTWKPASISWPGTWSATRIRCAMIRKN